MVKIHTERRSRKELLKNKLNTDLVGGLYTVIVNSTIWRNRYDVEAITRELHELGRQMGLVFYPLVSKTLDNSLIEKKIARYVEKLWAIIFSRKPNRCKWDEDSKQVIIDADALCQNVSGPLHFPFSEAIAGLLEAIVELALEDAKLKGRFSSLAVTCHESECKVKDNSTACKFVLSIRGGSPV